MQPVLKNIVKKNFESFSYFYSHLRYRVFFVFGLSFLIGVLDGFGLTMFLPLLHMVNDASSAASGGLGRLSFLTTAFQNLGIEFTLLNILLIMTLFFFFKGILYYIAGAYRVNVQQWFITKLRFRNIAGLNNLSYEHFVKSDAGRIQNTLTGEVDRVARSYAFYFRAIQNGILILVYLAFAFSVDAQFAILVSVGGFLTNFLYKSLYKYTKSSSQQVTLDSNDFQNLIIQNVTNYKYLKATASLDAYSIKLKDSIRKIERSNNLIGKLDALLTAGREPLLILVVAAVIYIQTTILGSHLGPILISLLFFYRALSYLIQMQMDWNRFLGVSGSVENMTLFEKELKGNREKKGMGAEIENFENLTMENLSFQYSGTNVLNKINLSIARNETIALVGESGSGKTTLVNIISGLLQDFEGGFKVNNKSINTLNIKSLQNKIGYITQDSIIFNDTIFNNITLWDEPSEKNKLKFREAIKKAALSTFVQNSPLQEQTILGNNGINLSGGQKQRISIARELYKEIDLLILDEATSALDSETEKAIQKSIDVIKGEKTIIIIAHRMATIKNVDKIIVLKNGTIANSGTFHELLGKSEYFRNLVELQEL